MNGFAELLYKPAHVITVLITYVSHAARLLAEELLIRNLSSGLWIWIEIIISMESINIISAYNVHSHLANIVGCSLQPRVQQRQLAILKTEYQDASSRYSSAKPAHRKLRYAWHDKD